MFSSKEPKQLVQTGAHLELVLSFLRERGVGRIDSIYVMASLMDKPVAEAKALLDGSRGWSDRYETDMQFRNAARAALHHLGFW